MFLLRVVILTGTTFCVSGGASKTVDREKCVAQSHLSAPFHSGMIWRCETAFAGGVPQ